MAGERLMRRSPSCFQHLCSVTVSGSRRKQDTSIEQERISHEEKNEFEKRVD